MKKDMFISARDDECRIAIVVDGAIAELYVERASYTSRVGNIYKGRITNVEPSIQAGFVDFGGPKNGFLHISDLHPEYFPGKGSQVEAVGKKRARRERPLIQACLRRGQEVIVQVTKDGIGTKGATMTTYLSIPGRYLVLMPGMARLGVSRKIEDEDARSKARMILQELNPPPDMGFIIRTAGMDQPKGDLQRDLQYLLRLWKAVEQRSKEAHAPAELYQESDLVIRTIRDVYTTDIERIVSDSEQVACKVKEFLHLILPRSANRVELYEEPVGLFHAFGIEAEIERISAPRVPLPAGGSLVIEQTEALVAIDVNSGRYRGSDNAEQMAVKINAEAAREVCRQLRLRDLGGVIIIDFIDMIEDKNRRRIEKIVRDELKQDRARTKALRMSQFGLMEMTRQRVRPSLSSSVSNPCPRCGGTGHVRTSESLALGAMRTLRLAAWDERIARIELFAPPEVAQYVFNQRRKEIFELEKRCAVRVLIRTDLEMDPSQIRLICADGRGMPVEWDAAGASEKRPAKLTTHEITKEDVAAFRKRQRTEPGQQASDQPEAEPAEEKPSETAKGQPAETAEAERTTKKRRRRRRKPKSDQPAEQAQAPAAEEKPAETQAGVEKPPEGDRPETAAAATANGEPPVKKKRRRRRRKPGAQSEGQQAVGEAPPAEKAEPPEPKAEGKPPGQPARPAEGNGRDADRPAGEAKAETPAGEAKGEQKPKSRRRRRKKKTPATADSGADNASESESKADAPSK